VKFLAAPELKGRGNGTEGLAKAADYIEEQFRKAGLKPAAGGNSYRQPFTVTVNARPGTANLVSTNGKPLTLGTDYLPLSFSSNGETEASVVFAGYGITAPEHTYDDYMHLDVKDKIVLVLRLEPPSFQKETGGKEKALTHHSQLVSKAINARNHGAKAIVLVNGEPEPGQEDTLMRFGSVSGPEDTGILIVQVKNAVANEWLAPSNKTVAGLQKEINAKPEPASFPLADAVKLALRVDVQRDRAKINNIIGYLPGKTSEYVILGAHYDHLGLGNESSLAPSQIGQVHPGADDNASGSAGLLELVRIFSARKEPLERGILFLSFAGEEIGLLGSAEWVNHPTMPLENAVAMINMDMIGRASGAKLFIGGTGTGSTFASLIAKAGAAYDFKIDSSASGYSSSDHISFVAKKIPVLFFFSGLHSDYHKPSDTWDKIDGPSAAKIVNLVADVATELASAGDRPQFVKVDVPSMPGGTGGGGYGPYFGSVPDFGSNEQGLKFADVRPGSPADKAGLKPGDILFLYGDKPIKNLYDFTYALRASKVGDVVVVKVLRDGKEVTAKVTLEQRK
jgi:hypothetical protein